MAEKKKDDAVLDFERLYKMDVSQFTETKKIGGKELNYLSWAHCARLLTMEDPNYVWKVLEFNDNGELVEYGHPYRKTLGGYEVRTRLTLHGITREMWLPVLDNNNLPMKDEPYTVKFKTFSVTVPAIDAAAINKAQMRCFVKTAALFGLGLYIFQGEDLPADDQPVVIDQETGEVKEAPKKEAPKQAATTVKAAPMTEEEARNHKFLDGGILKGHAVMELVEGTAEKPITDPEKALNLLKNFAEHGVGKDQEACAIIYKLVMDGKLKMPEVAKAKEEGATQ